MKKLTHLLLGATVLTLASCSQNEITGPLNVGDLAKAHYTVKLPEGYGTRGLGDGLAADQLNIYVYEVTTAEGSTTPTYTFAFDATADFEEGSSSTDVNIDLVVGKNYQLVFFASSPTSLTSESNSNGVYTITSNGTEGPVLSVNYSAMNSAGNNADAYDCFYASKNTGKVSATVGGTVELTRPVAQVNWGATGLSDSSTGNNYETIFGENGAYIQTSLSVSGVYTSMNLLTETYLEASTPENPVIIKSLTPPNPEDQSFPANTETTSYTYVAMQYLLVPSTSATYQLVLTISNNGEENPNGDYTNDITVSEAPLQANYQTNIYGNLLSSNASLTVSKGTWSGSNNQALVWDGSATVPTIDDDEKTVSVSQPSDLAGLAALVNGQAVGNQAAQDPNDFEGYTITLAADFDMNNNEFAGIGTASRADGTLGNGTKSFKGTFNGNGHTITNMVINAPSSATDNDVIAFIPSLDGEGSSVTNINFENLQIAGGAAEQAAVVGLVTNGATVSNINVNSGSVSATEGAAGIVGRLMGSGTISNCNNYANITVSKKNAGGIVGAAYYTASEDMEISNCNNYGNIVCNSTGTGSTLGGIVGTCAANITNCTNYGNVGNNSTATPVGGIVGSQNEFGTISGCVNKGVVEGSDFVGGIMGYTAAIGYTVTGNVTITGCTNEGNIIASGSAGGILGGDRWPVYVEKNTNSATSITGGSNAAGIVGNGYNSGTVVVYLSTDNTNNTPLENITATTKYSIYTGTVMINNTLYSNGEMPED